MTHDCKQHAEHIVKEFEGFLDAGTREAIGEESLGQLTMLIESAISTTVLEAMEKVSDQIVDLGHKIKNNAEHFDG
jgi:hypothetical protein